MKELIELRHLLHKHPELSGLEKMTAQIIKNFIKSYNPDEVYEKLGGNGLAFLFDSKKNGPNILFRCEIDGIPVQEQNFVPYKSINKGISHNCGHDGHMAIMCGVAKWVSKNPIKKGKLILLFQPAEENGQGAKLVLTDPDFKKLKIDYAFALHNMPAYPLHSVIIPESNFSSAVESICIKLQGKECHASEPDKGNNPSIAIAEIIKKFNELNKPKELSDEFQLLTPIHINMGQIAYGLSAAEGEIHYTLRAWNNRQLSLLKKEVLDLVKQITTRNQLTYTLNYLDYFPATKNDHSLKRIIEKTAMDCHLPIISNKTPFRFGEDFGWFSEKYPSFMFALGSGEKSPGLHHSNYDFPDELIKTGIEIYKSILQMTLYND